MSSPVAIEDRAGARRLTLDRPERRNALDRELVGALGEALADAATDTSVEVVVVNGAGPAFTAGIELETLRELGTPEGLKQIRAEFLEAWRTCWEMPKPTIAAIHGHCVGAGLELALACDLRVMAEDAVVGLPETRFGLVPDVGACARLAALIGVGRAKELIFTSAMVGAERAERIGLVERLAAPERLDDAVEELVAQLTSCSASASGSAKAVIEAAAMPVLEQSLAAELSSQLDLIGTKRHLDGVAALERSLGRG